MAGINQYATRQRVILQIRHSGSGCSDMDSASVVVANKIPFSM